MDWQDFWFIKRRNCLVNLVSSLCGLRKLLWWESKAFLNTFLSVFSWGFPVCNQLWIIKIIRFTKTFFKTNLSWKLHHYDSDNILQSVKSSQNVETLGKKKILETAFSHSVEARPNKQHFRKSTSGNVGQRQTDTGPGHIHPSDLCREKEWRSRVANTYKNSYIKQPVVGAG